MLLVVSALRSYSELAQSTYSFGPMVPLEHGLVLQALVDVHSKGLVKTRVIACRAILVHVHSLILGA